MRKPIFSELLLLIISLCPIFTALVYYSFSFSLFKIRFTCGGYLSVSCYRAPYLLTLEVVDYDVPDEEMVRNCYCCSSSGV